MRFAATRRVSGGSVVGQMDADHANGYTRCDEVERLGLFFIGAQWLSLPVGSHLVR